MIGTSGDGFDTSSGRVNSLFDSIFSGRMFFAKSKNWSTRTCCEEIHRATILSQFLREKENT